MRHPSEGVLRRLLDEPAGVADPDRDHAAGCPRCRIALTTIDDDRTRVDAALATDLDALERGALDLDAAWQRLVATTTTAPATDAGSATPFDAGRTGPTARTRRARRRRVAAGVAAASVLVGASAAAATGWLPIFRAEEVAPLEVTAADLNALPDLSAFGSYELAGSPEPRDVADAAAATAATGLSVPVVTDLPRGVEGEPAHQVVDEASATFTFSADRAARAAADQGEELPPPPPALDGARVRLVAGPAVAAVWDGTTGPPALVVARAVAPTALSDGVPFSVLRDYLLDFPGLPDDLAVQLRTFDADGSTLPLPVPADRLGAARTVQVDGAEATVLATEDETLAAVVWVEDGIVTAVAGALGADEAVAVAEGIR